MEKNISKMADMFPEDLVQAVQDHIRNKAMQTFSQASIADYLLNRISLSIIELGNDHTDIYSWVEHQFVKEVEAYFSELQAYCYYYALKISGQPETAEDIAQDTIRELLSAKQQISCIKAWLSRVTHNKLVQHIKANNKDNTLSKQLIDYNTEAPLDPDEDKLPDKLPLPSIKKLLSKRDYSVYSAIRKCKTLKEYAELKQISYQTAKEHKHRIKVNLRSAYLKQQGWQDSPDILSYQQLIAIKRFMQNLISTFGEPNAGSKGKNSISVAKCDLVAAFKGTNGIHKWQIRSLNNNLYMLTIAAKSQPLPTIIRMKIKLNRANRISILTCSLGEIIAQMPSGDRTALTSFKGKDVINYERLISLLPNATVYDAERFQNFLMKIKPK
jgi:DNA-directed RNA polymerase specialized sigma24 family protein